MRVKMSRIEQFNRMLSDAENIIQALQRLDEASLGTFDVVTHTELQMFVTGIQQNFDEATRALSSEALESEADRAIITLEVGMKRYVSAIYTTVVNEAYLDSLITDFEAQLDGLMRACEMFADDGTHRELLAKWKAFYQVHTMLGEIKQAQAETARIEANNQQLRRETRRVEAEIETLPRRTLDAAQQRLAASNQRLFSASQRLNQIRQEMMPESHNVGDNVQASSTSSVSRIFSGAQDRTTSAVSRIFDGEQSDSTSSISRIFG